MTITISLELLWFIAGFGSGVIALATAYYFIALRQFR